jgi:hypothetical protein
VPTRVQAVEGPTAAEGEQVRGQQHAQNEDFEIHHWLLPCAKGLALKSRREIGDVPTPCLVAMPRAIRLASPMRSNNSAAMIFFFGRRRAAFRMEYISTGLSHGEKAPRAEGKRGARRAAWTPVLPLSGANCCVARSACGRQGSDERLSPHHDRRSVPTVIGASRDRRLCALASGVLERRRAVERANR